MAIPDYQTLMLFVLNLVSDGQDHKLILSVESFKDGFELSATGGDSCAKNIFGLSSLIAIHQKIVGWIESKFSAINLKHKSTPPIPESIFAPILNELFD